MQAVPRDGDDVGVPDLGGKEQHLRTLACGVRRVSGNRGGSYAYTYTPRCSLVKLEVEGYGMHVLSGAEELVNTHRPTIFGEYSPSWLGERFSNGPLSPERA